MPNAASTLGFTCAQPSLQVLHVNVQEDCDRLPLQPFHPQPDDSAIGSLLKGEVPCEAPAPQPRSRINQIMSLPRSQSRLNFHGCNFVTHPERLMNLQVIGYGVSTRGHEYNLTFGAARSQIPRKASASRPAQFDAASTSSELPAEVTAALFGPQGDSRNQLYTCCIDRGRAM